MTKRRKITRDPRLAKRRDELVCQLYEEGFFQDEIGEIFRLTFGRISQILNKKVEKNNKVK